MLGRQVNVVGINEQARALKLVVHILHGARSVDVHNKAREKGMVVT